MNWNTKIFATLTVIAVCSLALVIKANVAPGPKLVRKIVIDAGHGGKDPGCHGQYSYEKDIALDVAKKTGTMLKQKYGSGVEILYTRTYDVLAGGDHLSTKQSLQHRHKVANDAKADLFVSVHINSSAKRVTTAKGTETYVLGLHRNEQKEGAIGEYSGNFSGGRGMLNPSDPTTAIIVAQYSQAFLANSILLGTKIEDQFTNAGRYSKGVKQKGLEVLAGSAMPGVLVELGFLNNPAEESLLASDYGKTQCANAIFKGIQEYKAEVEGQVKQN